MFGEQRIRKQLTDGSDPAASSSPLSVYCIFSLVPPRTPQHNLCRLSCLVLFLSVSLALHPQASASQSILAWRLTGGMNTSQLAIHTPPPLPHPRPSTLPFLRDPSLSTYLKVRISCILIGVSIFRSPSLSFLWLWISGILQTSNNNKTAPPLPTSSFSPF